MGAQKQFEELWCRIGAKGDAAAVFELLGSHYTDKRRAYHNLKHIESCLDELKNMRGRCENADAVEFALWFHDVIYDSKAKDNEEQSAWLARRIAREVKLPATFGARVQALILATKHAAVPEENDARIIVDI